jgi:Rv2525c-like, glycoside hydrolase-like domain
MSKGISTDLNISGIASCLRSQGLDFVFRYYSASDWKRMERPEAVAIAAAGLKLAVVYEDGPPKGNPNGYFTKERGNRHGTDAYAFASDVIHQPLGSAIYFAIDYDYTDQSNLTGVLDYFIAVRDAIKDQSGGGSKLDYKIGVYGSGFVCNLIKERKNLAELSWLAESTGVDGLPELQEPM